MSIRDDILDSKDDLRRKEVVAWGRKLWVWELTGAERDEFEAGRVMQKGRKTILDFKGSRAKLVVASLRESGDPGAALVFQPDDVRRLQKKGGFELDKVYGAAAEISGITAGDDDEEDALPTSGQPSVSSSS